MFSDDTNLFFEHVNLIILFSIVNEELNKIYQWFNIWKLSLNADKTKYSLLHKPSKTNDLPLLLSKLLINDNEVERVGSIKFLGVLLDEYLSWKEHIKYTENKVTKSFGLLYRAKPIHSHLLNYRSLSWVSASRINLKKLLSQHKHEIRFFNNKTLFEHAKELFNS